MWPTAWKVLEYKQSIYKRKYLLLRYMELPITDQNF